MTTSGEHEAANDAKAAAHETGEHVKDAAHSAGEKAKGVGERMKNAVEDVIPGDSDHDGH